MEKNKKIHVTRNNGLSRVPNYSDDRKKKFKPPKKLELMTIMDSGDGEVEEDDDTEDPDFEILKEMEKVKLKTIKGKKAGASDMFKKDKDKDPLIQSSPGNKIVKKRKKNKAQKQCWANWFPEKAAK